MASQLDEKDGFRDPSKIYPKREYVNVASTNQAARGIVRNELAMGGGDQNVSLDLKPMVASQYPFNAVKETVSGHITEIDDTPGAERMLFRHRTGAGVEIRADGTVIVASVHNTIRISGGDEKVIIEGDGEISYNGNLTLNVSGDYDLRVGGNYNVQVSGDVDHDIRGSYKEQVHRNYQSTLKKNKTEYILGTHTETTLGSHNEFVKGSVKHYIEGSEDHFVGGTLKMTAEDEVFMTAPNTNIAAQSLTVIGDSGTIGGENIIGYDYNHYTGHSLTATDTISTNTAIVSQRTTSPEFVGSLTGNADTATQAGRAGTAGALGAGGSAGSKVTGTPTAVDTTATELPTTTIMTDYVTKSDRGVRLISLDNGDVLKNQIDKSVDYGGVSSRRLTTPEIRSKLRDPNTLSNMKFIGAQIAEGKLSPTYINATPPAIGRVVKNVPGAKRGITAIGRQSKGKTKRTQA